MDGITADFESYQNEISALATHVNGVDFALGKDGDLHLLMARANHHTDPVHNQPHLQKLWVQNSFN